MKNVNKLLKMSMMLSMSALSLTSCSNKNEKFSQSVKEPIISPRKTTIDENEQPLIAYDFKAGEIKQKCDAALVKASERIETLKNSSDSSFAETLLKFDTILTDLSDETTPLTFMGYVSTDESLRDEGSTCEGDVGQFYPPLYADKKLYEVLKSGEATSENEKRLKSETLLGFEKNGMNLEDSKLAHLVEVKQQLSKAQADFSSNLNEAKATLSFSKKELEGLSENALSHFTKTAGDRYIVTLKSTDYLAVMENASNSETRRRMLDAYLNRAADKNTDLLSKAVVLREEIAKILGYKTWAHYQIDGRMAGSAENVLQFLHGLKDKLGEGNKKDLSLLLARKQKDDKNAVELNAWDITYYSNQIKKEKFNLDDEKIAEYFPAEHVMNGLFYVYSTLLHVNFREVTNAKTWAEGVKMYEVLSKEDGSRISFFFVDSIPRPGKYGHAAAFPLINGRITNSGNYSVPVSSIVCNFTPPTNGKPSLMTHDEVETLFHEFGHIMHQTLTRAPFGTLSGTAVAQDFVEAPSQMLENWVWNKEILNIVSGNFKNLNEKLPDELLNQMLASKSFNRSYAYTRQLLFALYDMEIHTQSGEVDVNAVFQKMHEEIQGVRPLETAHFPASFGHLMGGYDAGYYGYLWSEVYAQDMFSRFEKEGLLNEKTGLDYKKSILENGSMKPALDLLTSFLGRKPNSDAFYRSLGL